MSFLRAQPLAPPGFSQYDRADRDAGGKRNAAWRASRARRADGLVRLEFYVDGSRSVVASLTDFDQRIDGVFLFVLARVVFLRLAVLVYSGGHPCDVVRVRLSAG